MKGDDRYIILGLKAGPSPFRAGVASRQARVSLLQQLIVTKLCPTQQEQEAILYTKDDHEALDWVANGRERALPAQRHEGQRSAGRRDGG